MVRRSQPQDGITPDEDLARLGDNIRTARARLGRAAGERITQEELGHRAGVHRTRMGEIERGRVAVSIRTLFRIARALEVPPASLLDGIE